MTSEARAVCLGHTVSACPCLLHSSTSKPVSFRTNSSTWTLGHVPAYLWRLCLPSLLFFYPSYPFGSSLSLFPAPLCIAGSASVFVPASLPWSLSSPNTLQPSLEVFYFSLDDCNTSSESSDTSDSAGCSPPPCQVKDTPSHPSPPYAAWGPRTQATWLQRWELEGRGFVSHRSILRRG